MRRKAKPSISSVQFSTAPCGELTGLVCRELLGESGLPGPAGCRRRCRRSRWSLCPARSEARPRSANELSWIQLNQASCYPTGKTADKSCTWAHYSSYGAVLVRPRRVNKIIGCTNQTITLTLKSMKLLQMGNLSEKRLLIAAAHGEPIRKEASDSCYTTDQNLWWPHANLGPRLTAR